MQEFLITAAVFILSLLWTAGRIFNECESIKYLQALAICVGIEAPHFLHTLAGCNPTHRCAEQLISLSFNPFIIFYLPIYYSLRACSTCCRCIIVATRCQYCTGFRLLGSQENNVRFIIRYSVNPTARRMTDLLH